MAYEEDLQRLIKRVGYDEAGYQLLKIGYELSQYSDRGAGYWWMRVPTGGTVRRRRWSSFRAVSLTTLINTVNNELDSLGL